MRSVFVGLLIGRLCLVGDALGQPPTAPSPSTADAPSTVRVFIDCPDGCDSTFLRTELNFVDHVRDREVADVHILVTEVHTGSGGTEYTVAFIGLRRFAAITDTVKYVSQPGDTEDADRRGVLRAMKLGLVRYVSQTQLAGRLDVVFRPLDEDEDEAMRPPPGQTTEDPWNFWVFRLRGNTNLSGEESATSIRLSGSFAATRVTEAWKAAANLSANYRRNRYTFEEDDEDDYTTISRDSSMSGTLIKSLGSHWGAGGRIALTSSTYTNHQHLFKLTPAIEYNLFPYAETSRRELTFTYSVGLLHAAYREETLYGKLQEWLLNHAFAVNWDMKQPWGSADLQVEASQYLPDTQKNRLSIDGGAEIRLFKGFSLDIGGDVSFIRDQIYLPARDAEPEEILLRLRQIATSYDYSFSIGFSYSFGSVYNNVVNTRLSSF